MAELHRRLDQRQGGGRRVRRRHLLGPAPGLSGPAAPGPPARALPPRRGAQRRHRGPDGAPPRSLHAGVPAAQPARHPRAARGRRAGVSVTNEGTAAEVLDRRARGARATGRNRHDEPRIDHVFRSPRSPRWLPPRQKCLCRQRAARRGLLLGILAVVLLITVAKLHPFLALMLGSAVLGAGRDHAARRHRQQLHRRLRRHTRAGRACSSPSAP